MEIGAIVKQEYEKLPKINSNKDSFDEKNLTNCIVPLIENNNTNNNKTDKINEENLKKFNQSVPDDLIISLKQAEIPKEFLGPPSKRNTQNAIRPSVPSILKKPDNAWNYEKQREKFKFLMDQPICSCGAGKDISFIYDCALHKSASKSQPSKYDLSAIRAAEQIVDKPIQIPETIVPEEYRIVKNQGVLPLRVEEQPFTTIPQDHTNHLTVFPSLRPVGRSEVIQLKHTMDALLKRVGADIIDQKGPTQLHNLLEIIKQEQDIYNIIFHEVIRQVTVECKERGEILAKLRERYANLLARVPREIKSLHEEIIAQRALDRRLTEELVHFKSTIGYLTDELIQVKDHDKKISEQAGIYKKDLQEALTDAQKNASLLKEYHELYELQRKRLEKTIETLTNERDIWIKASYSIGLKVIHENKLNTAKRLNIAENSWSKLAKQFALFISDKDTQDLNKIQSNTETWKETIDELRNEINLKEVETKKTLQIISNELENLKNNLAQNSFDKTGKLIQKPDSKKIMSLMTHMKRILEISIKEADNFAGDAVLINEEKIKKGERLLYQIVQLCNRVSSRHDATKDKNQPIKYMNFDKLQIDIKQLHEQFRTRAGGENGLSKYLISLNNGIDVWLQKLNSELSHEHQSKSKLKLNDVEWQAFYQSMDEWIEYIQKSIRSVGWPLKESNEVHLMTDSNEFKEESKKIVSLEDLFNSLNHWLSTNFNHIDSQDAALIEQVTVHHTKMLHWMIQTLIRLAPDRVKLSEEAKKLIYNNDTNIETLELNANDLISLIQNFTTSLVTFSNSILSDDENSLPGLSAKSEKDLQDLLALQNDCKEWIYTVKLLIAELNGDKSHRQNIGDRLTHHSAIHNLEELHDVDADDNDGNVSRVSSHSTSNETGNLDEEKTTLTEKSERVVDEKENDNQNVKELKNQTEKSNQNQQQETNNAETSRNNNNKQGESTTGVTFEVLASDSNTEREFLENINLDESNHLTETELRTTVFNAFKTIEKLQDELVNTEERAQRSEARVAEIELKLKEAMERIRHLER